MFVSQSFRNVSGTGTWINKKTKAEKSGTWIYSREYDDFKIYIGKKIYVTSNENLNFGNYVLKKEE